VARRAGTDDEELPVPSDAEPDVSSHESDGVPAPPGAHRPTALDRVVPVPRLLEVDTVELALPRDRAWEVVRHLDLSASRIATGLFAVRTLPARLTGHEVERPQLRIDDLESTPAHPGFRILVDDPPHEVVVGAIGQVWQPDIPFVHLDDAEAYAAFDEPGWVEVAWALQVDALDDRSSRVGVEVRVTATDEDSWVRFRRYFRLIGPASRLIRHSILHDLARRYGTPAQLDRDRTLPGDDLVPDAQGQLTDSVTIGAHPDQVWPWLVQMGGTRAGFYSLDLFDNAGLPSAREIHPEWQDIAVGDVLPATPDGGDGFEVLRVEPDRLLLLGGLFDAEAGRQLAFAAPRPERFWHVTWAFVLEPLLDGSTRVTVRARAAFPGSGELHAAWIGPVHRIMERTQLRHLAARVEGRAGGEGADAVHGLRGAARMAAGLLTPFLRERRSTWGVDEATAGRLHPGDDLVPTPRWQWTHGIEIEAPAEDVWPWVAQIGADKGGFYSYQWLENLVGCDVHNAERVHPDWAVQLDGTLSLHPDLPPLRVTALDPGRWFVAYAGPDGPAEERTAADEPWVATSWLFLVEAIGPDRSRFVSRYRCATSDDLTTRLQFGPALIEPIGFAMDREMLLGVRRRAEGARRPPP
jgi:hypothetical protein